MARTSDDRREDSARGIVTGEAGLAHTGAVVDDEGLDLIFFIFVVTHVV
jgi:hypothetical protein